jgi:uncharacterized YigZ family protein
MSVSSYFVPTSTVRIEHEVSRSRFIATLSNAATVQEARASIAAIRAEMPDATHHVYAFKVGYGASVTEGLSDDGEPAGTAGPPVMAVLRGADVGDTVIIVTRYFGGTKLGTGGLVRAYGDAARAVIAAMVTREKIEMRRLRLTLPYTLYERARLIAANHRALIDDEVFEVEVTLYLTLPVTTLEAFTAAIRDLSAGRVTPVLLDG